MKKKALICSLLFVMICMSGCSVIRKEMRSGMKWQVTVSFTPLLDFTKKIGGDKVSVSDVTPSIENPHTYQPPVRKLKKLKDAELFIYQGNVENWSQNVVQENKNLSSIQADQGIDLLEEDNGKNPHIWLNPQYAKVELANIRDALVSLDPDEKSYYEKRYQKYAKEFDALDASFKKALSPYRGKRIIAMNDSLRYLCDAYGLKLTVVHKTSDLAKDDRVVYYDDFTDPTVLRGGENVKRIRIHTFDGRTSEEKKDKKGYETLMKENLELLVKELKQG